MKKSIALFILTLLVFHNTSGLWIIGAFYINQDYIAKNVCINRFDAVPLCKGQCYLSRELKANESHQEKFPTVSYKEIQLFCESWIDFSFAANTALFKKSYPIFKIGPQKSVFIFSIYHPPRCT
jgi:hypothetical protein